MDRRLVEFGLLVRKKRKERHWTLETAAEEILGNRSRKGFLSEIENGKRTPLTNETVNRFADKLAFSPIERSQFIDNSNQVSNLASVGGSHDSPTLALGVDGRHSPRRAIGPMKGCTALIFVNASMPYARDCEDGLRSLAYRELLKLNVYMNFHSVDVVASDDGNGDMVAIDQVNAAIEEWNPSFAFSIGTGASVHVRKAISTLSNSRRSRIKQVFLMVSDPIAAQLTDPSSDNPNEVPITGVRLSLTTDMRLDFIRRHLKMTNIAVLYDQRYRVDRTGLKEIDEYRAANSMTYNLYSIDECKSNQLSVLNESDADVVFGWTGVHFNMRYLAKYSALPIFGGGRVDVRNGATIALSEDERQFSEICVNKILLPHFMNGIDINNLPIQSTVPKSQSLSHEIFADEKSLTRYEIPISPFVARNITMISPLI